MDVHKARVEFKYNRQENTTRHHTEDYENDVLVLRRGAAFDIGLTFSNVPLSDSKNLSSDLALVSWLIKIHIDQT